MNRIRLLPEHVANQIAAGEVVERPASVVKELVENALDAQATRVTVEIQAGGRSLIRVTDDGLGMSRDDALLCLERHATSKIQRAEDLAAIATMGFRGEALPSIASVSRMSLVTRERDATSPDGTQVIIHGGKILEVKAAGTPAGTSVEVRQLFFNLPARRKFLRSEETEYSHVHHYLTLAALAHPGVAFTFLKDGRTLWQLPPAVPTNESTAARLAALRERMRAVMGGEEQLTSVDFHADLAPLPEHDLDESATPAEPKTTDARPPGAATTPGLRVWGWIGSPGVSRGTREAQYVFVNRRPVENRGLNFALLEGYHTALMKGRYPVCGLFLEIDPSRVDVNIHPSKREVKFHDERGVRGLVAQAVSEALRRFHGDASLSQRALPAPKPSALPAPAPEIKVQPGVAAPSPAPAERDLRHWLPPAPNRSAETKSAPSIEASPTTPSPQTALPFPTPLTHSTHLTQSTPVPHTSPPTVAPATASASAPAVPVPLLHVPLRLVGVVGRLYVVLESDRGLVLMDQHAAHERILFEQMLNRLEQGGVPSQRLLLPETVELSPRDAHFLREQLPALTRLGVGLSEFGERTFLLDALPPMVKARAPRQFVLELIDELKATGAEINSHRLGEHTIAKTVCRHAVKANDPLSGPELENLLQDLRQCAMPYTCPHGRPTLIEMNFRELERKFGRLQ